jgi:Tfp pilus assembly protein PilP
MNGFPQASDEASLTHSVCILWGLDMRRQAIVLLAGTLGLLAVGCGANDNAEVASSPSPEASPAATTQPFDAPLVSPKDGKDGKNAKVAASKTNKIAGLLESTDPEERAKQVQAGIRSRAGLDPFASLPATLTFSLPTDSSGSNGNIASNGLNNGGGRPRLGNLTAGGGGQSPLVNLGGPRGGGPRGGGSTIASINAIPSFPVVEPVRRPTQVARGPVGTSGLNAPGDKGLKPLPPLPEPKLAQAVEVTGVVTIGGITQAIIKAPNEPTGRHVEVGQRLSNGQVLVKRIEANAGSDPIVVFEENGQEVSRGVGEKSTPETGDTPTV